MRCDEIRPRFEAYIDGEIAEPERTQLRDHLSDCPECGLEAMALQRLRDDIRQAAPTYHAPEALRSQIRLALRHEAAATTRAARFAPGWLAYAASILLAVALGSGGTLLITGAGSRLPAPRARDQCLCAAGIARRSGRHIDPPRL